jgi:hypothetical protein
VEEGLGSSFFFAERGVVGKCSSILSFLNKLYYNYVLETITIYNIREKNLFNSGNLNKNCLSRFTAFFLFPGDGGGIKNRPREEEQKLVKLAHAAINTRLFLYVWMKGGTQTKIDFNLGNLLCIFRKPTKREHALCGSCSRSFEPRATLEMPLLLFSKQIYDFLFVDCLVFEPPHVQANERLA